MKNKLLKNICLCFFITLGIFFVNTVDVKAADSCTCYFSGQADYQQTASSGGISRNEIGIPTYDSDGKREHPSTISYLLELKVYNEKHFYTKSDISYFGTRMEREINDSNAASAGMVNRTSSIIMYPEDGISITTDYIVKKQCNKDKCNSLKLKVNEDGKISFHRDYDNKIKGKAPLELHAVDADVADGLKNGLYTKEQTENSEESARGYANVEEIIQWGKDGGNKKTYGQENLVDRCSVIPEDVQELLNTAFSVITIAGIIILIIMSMIEFIKAITGANDDLIKTAFKHTLIRIVCAIALLVLPMIINMVINMVNSANTQTDENGNVIIGEDGNPLCNIG